jgi:plasmid stabilization system protein ParE
MKYKVLVTESAARELDEAFDWLVERTLAHAPAWYNGLLDAINSLSEMPARCPLCPYREKGDRKTRQLVYGDKHAAYLIIFEIRGAEVLVWHVRHASKRPRNN